MQTTHEEKVKMLRDESLDNVNGMWLTLLMHGTPEARVAFSSAALEVGFVLLSSGLTWAGQPRVAPS